MVFYIFMSLCVCVCVCVCVKDRDGEGGGRRMGAEVLQRASEVACVYEENDCE
jgi:hypothetical protein